MLERIKTLEDTVESLSNDLRLAIDTIYEMRMHIPGPVYSLVYLPQRSGDPADGSLLSGHDHADPASCGCYAAGVGDGRQEVRLEQEVRA